MTGCGRKGPPLPPLRKLPAAPAEITAERHGATVDIQFVVPGANTDGTRPANIARVDVYGVTGPQTLTDDEVLKLGTKIASLPVKAPRNPNETIEPDEPESEMEPPLGSGLAQGARARLVERVTPEAQTPVDVARTVKPGKRAAPAVDETDRPLVPPAATVPARMYVGVGVSTKGRHGPLSQRAIVAMISAPPPLGAPGITYDERAVTISWTPVETADTARSPKSAGVLPSKPIGVALPTFAYNVYEVSDTAPPAFTRLTATPVGEPAFADPRIAWGEHRCYAVRVVETIEGGSLESDESPPRCVTLTDTFAPAAPKGVQAVPSEGAINLIWDANTEKDIRGYIVMRALASAEALEPIMSEPIQETSFTDRVKPGVRFVYAVQAVDTAGNVSQLSERVEETAR